MTRGTSKQYGESVCCAVVTAQGIWKRLYPIRFRHLQGDQSFSRWDRVIFKYRHPTRDKRAERRHVFEGTISVDGVFRERESYRAAAQQESYFDQKLAELEPSSYAFRFSFEDEDGKHSYQDGDWETHAMFLRERHRTSEQATLRWMSEVFNEQYPRKGMAFAIGNMAKRPQTWQLPGVIRLDESPQSELAL